MEKENKTIVNHYHYYGGTHINGETHISGGTHILGGEGKQHIYDIGGDYNSGADENSASTDPATTPAVTPAAPRVPVIFDSAAADNLPATPPLEELATPQALEILEMLVAGGLMDANWQPAPELSAPERGILAHEVAVRLNITNFWQLFGNLWSVKAETLRRKYNSALDQQKTSAFIERFKKAVSPGMPSPGDNAVK